MYVTAYNPADTPVVVSESGRIIGGHDWGTVKTTDDVGRIVLDNEWVVQQSQPDDDTADTNPRAASAFKQTDVWAKRLDKVSSLDKQVLTDDARAKGYIGPEDEPLKEALEELYAENVSYDIPRATPEPKKESKPTTDSKKEGS